MKPTSKKRRKPNEDLRLPTTPEKLAKAVMQGGAPRQRTEKKVPQEV